MKNRHIPPKQSYRPSQKRRGSSDKSFPIKPGRDKALTAVFKKIGIPEKKTFVPDNFQLEAIAAIKTSDCLVTAPTGAGKTWIAQEVTKHTVDQGGKVWYATPLKALSNSIFGQFCDLFGQANVGILTGDIKDNTRAPIVIGTTEILRNQLYDAMSTGENLKSDLIILDEAHFLGDEQRGVVWEEIMIYLPVRIPLLLLSATIGNPDEIAKWLESIRGKTCRIIENHDRPVPLYPLFMHPSGTLFPFLQNKNSTKLHKKVYKYHTAKSPRYMAPPGKLPLFSEILNVLDTYNLLPAIFFLKSRAECDQAIRLCSRDLLAREPDKKRALLEQIDAMTAGSPHLENHRHRPWLEKTGCAAHHSGLLPAWKVIVETLMVKGLLYAMFATSTVAAGVNFPARSVVVLNSDRFNGIDFAPLTSNEFTQMSGRAGRRGMDHIGFGIMLPGKFMDLEYVGRLLQTPAQDIESRLHINFSMVLNLLLSHTPEQVRLLLDKSLASYQIMTGRKKAQKKARKKFGFQLEHLWNDFLDHMDFLIDEAFVTPGGGLTEDGVWASKLRIDAPLLVAQSLRLNLLPASDPALLAAIMGSFVNEKEFKDDLLYDRSLPKSLKEAFLDTRKYLKPFALKLMSNGFDAPNLFIQPALQLYFWAHDEPWENLVTGSDFSDGDFARLILRTGENLRQLSKLNDCFPQIATAARNAMDLILKEPVISSFS